MLLKAVLKKVTCKWDDNSLLKKCSVINLQLKYAVVIKLLSAISKVISSLHMTFSHLSGNTKKCQKSEYYLPYMQSDFSYPLY